MLFYLDESGNTGTNWLDPNQPYFVYAGWLIKQSCIDSASQRIKALDALSPGTELKSTELLDNHKKEFFRLLTSLIEDELALPLFVVYDKRYMMATKIVETFFDYTHNPSLKPQITGQAVLKKTLATSIIKNTQLIDDFGAIYAKRNIDYNTFNNIYIDLKNHFINVGLREVADSLNGISHDNLQSMIEENKSSRNHLNNKPWFSLTYPSLFQLMYNIEGLGKTNNTQITVFVDELSGYEDVINSVESFSHTLFSDIHSISQGESTSIEMIRAADFLCGYIRKCITDTSYWSKVRSSRDFWKWLLKRDAEYTKKNIRLFDYDAVESSFENKIESLSGKKETHLDYSTEYIKQRYFEVLR